jgi:hypothetical protein
MSNYNDPYNIDILYSYVVNIDTGFAPNPYHGICSLACCGKLVRKDIGNKFRELRITYENLSDEFKENNSFSDFRAENKMKDIWVIGMAGSNITPVSDRYPIYLMKVTEILTFKEYDEKYPEKRPRCKKMENGEERPTCLKNGEIPPFDSKNCTCTDGSYLCSGDSIYNSKYSRHTEEEMKKDMNPEMGYDVVLVSEKNNHIYFGSYFKTNPNDKGLEILKDTKIVEKNISVLDDFKKHNFFKSNGSNGHNEKTLSTLKSVLANNWHEFFNKSPAPELKSIYNATCEVSKPAFTRTNKKGSCCK